MAGETQRLAQYVTTARFDDLPDRVRHEAKRSFLNWLGAALGAARHPAMEAAARALAVVSGPPQATVLGRNTRTDILHAAFLNGLGSHIFDFDDTHLRTVIHPSGPIAPTVLALAEHRGIAGAELLLAFVLGIEVSCRAGNAVYPSHYDVGWHITGTTGSIGSAAAAARLLGLDAQRTSWAMGLGATQPVGLREMFGTMTKPFHPGRAAENGLLAALLAGQGFNSSEQALEAKRGWANVLASDRNLDELTMNLGQTYEILSNSYKPFACGIVIHPVIDACVRLRNRHGLKADDVEAIDARVHPLVLELTGKTEPMRGLEGKFSVYHSAAVALIDGQAAEEQYSDARVRDPAVVALRHKVTATVDPSTCEDQAVVRIRLAGGRVVEERIEHAIGSVHQPMSDADLEAKFRALAGNVLDRESIDHTIALVWDLERLPDVRPLIAACRGR